MIDCSRVAVLGYIFFFTVYVTFIHFIKFSKRFFNELDSDQDQ